MSTPELRKILKEFCKAFNRAVENKTKYPTFPDECVGMTCGAKTRAGTPCKLKSIYYENGRCKYHGGLSTGPKTHKGKRRSALNGFKARRKRSPWRLHKTQYLENNTKPILRNEIIMHGYAQDEVTRSSLAKEKDAEVGRPPSREFQKVLDVANYNTVKVLSKLLVMARALRTLPMNWLTGAFWSIKGLWGRFLICSIAIEVILHQITDKCYTNTHPTLSFL